MNRGTLLRGALSLALLAFLATRADWGRIADLVEQARPGPLLAALAVLLLQPLISSARLRMLLAARGRRVPYADVVRTVYSSNFVGSFLPAGVGGDVLRAAALIRGAVPVPAALAAIATDRICGGLSLVLTTAPLAAAAWFLRGSAAEAAVAALPAALVLASAGVAWSRPVWRAAQGLYRRFPRLPGRGFLRRTHHQVAGYGRHPAALARGVALSLGVQATRFLSFWLCARALGLDLGPARAAEAMFPAMIFSLVPISVGGWGVREGLLVFLLPLERSEALGLALLHRLTGMAATLPGALVFGSRDLRLAEEER